MLDSLISQFPGKLLAEVCRGLPRLYHQCEDDLPALRGRLDVVRQLTRNAVRPDRLACRYDQLDADTPLMRIMATACTFLSRFARSAATRRTLVELRHVLADIPALPVNRLAWKDVRLDRTNRRWGSLLRRALAGTGIDVVAQGGLRYCLGEWVSAEPCTGNLFQAKPDIIPRRGNAILAILDTKWKAIAEPFEGKGGVSRADIYQLMAYARLYARKKPSLLYPSAPGGPAGERRVFGIAGGNERLRIAQVDVAGAPEMIVAALRGLFVGQSSSRQFGAMLQEVLVREDI